MAVRVLDWGFSFSGGRRPELPRYKAALISPLHHGHWHSNLRLSFLPLSPRRIRQTHTMWPSSRNSSQPQAMRQEKKSISGSFRAENLIPGVVIGFIIGMILDLSQQVKSPVKRSRLLSSKVQKQSSVPGNGKDQELKMVLVVRQDLKMRTGKIASQCAHAATGMYAELMQSDRYLLRRWEENGQPKIVVTCKNQQEMNKITEAAESVGLPTFVVADAGRTEVAAGSRTVLAVGPGPKELVDSITGRLALL